MKHFPFIETAVKIANSGWGKPMPDQDAAIRELIGNPEKLAAFATLELVRRFHEFARNMVGRETEQRREYSRPENAVKFPTLKAGDKVYTADLDECGVNELVIVGIDEDGFAIICQTDITVIHEWCIPRYATQGYFDSEATALRRAAENDIAYHGPRYEHAKTVLAAIEAGEDLSRFREPRDFDAEVEQDEESE